MDLRRHFRLANTRTGGKTQNETIRENIEEIRKDRESFQRWLAEEKKQPTSRD